MASRHKNFGLICSTSACTNPAKCKGLCDGCYNRYWRKNNPDKAKKRAVGYKASQKIWRMVNKRRMKGHHLRKFWPGSTWQEALANYDTLVKLFNNRCAICNEIETAIDWQTNKPKELAVDHCHKTGRVRGLLCQKHNHVIGLISENLDLLLKIKQYIIKK